LIRLSPGRQAPGAVASGYQAPAGLDRDGDRLAAADPDPQLAGLGRDHADREPGRGRRLGRGQRDLDRAAAPGDRDPAAEGDLAAPPARGRSIEVGVAGEADRPAVDHQLAVDQAVGGEQVVAERERRVLDPRRRDRDRRRRRVDDRRRRAGAAAPARVARRPRRPLVATPHARRQGEPRQRRSASHPADAITTIARPCRPGPRPAC
jgi:hypothetical protein